MKMMKKIILIAASVLLLAGCGKKQALPVKEISEKSKDHQWYFFTNQGFEQTSLPQKSGISSLKPWTETLRGSDGNTSSDGKGFLLVNRMGLIIFEDSGNPVLLHDYQLFSNSTASNLIFDNGNPYITLSRSSFFNKTAALDSNKTEEDSNRPYLVRIARETRNFFPAITYGDLNLADAGEITGTHFDGKDFHISIKTMKGNKTYFSYAKFNCMAPLETLQPFTQSGKVNLSESSETAFRSKVFPFKYEEAPKRLKNLLKSIPDNFNFTIACRNAGGVSPRLYATSFDEDILTQANAIISDGWSCAVFSDGTTYFNGALDGRHVLNGGKNTAFRLPKLPENYIYGPFCISGNKLAVCWEESDFYKTGRSGFLVVDLGKVLYGDPL